MDSTVQEYINKMREAGKSDSEIKQAMVRAGWDEKDIVLEEQNKQQPVLPPPPPPSVKSPALKPLPQQNSSLGFRNNSSKKNLFIIVGFLVFIILIGVGYWAYDYYLKDTDGDGLIDRIEKDIGTDLTIADTDGDGLLDGEEVDLNLDPLLSLDDTEINSETIAQLFSGDQGSIHFWTRSTDWHTYEYRNLVNFLDSSDRERVLIRKATQYGTTDDYLSFILYPTGKPYSAWTVSTEYWNDNEWIHVAIVWEKNVVVDLYMNGIKLINYVTEEHATNTFDKSELDVLQESGTLYQSGRLKEENKNSQIIELKIINEKLSPDRINEIYNNGI